jgi:hypothetical protein
MPQVTARDLVRSPTALLLRAFPGELEDDRPGSRH